MNLLKNPVVLIALGLLLGVGTAVGLVWIAAKPLVAELAAARAAATTVVRPERPWDFWTIEIEGLASELKEQKDALKAREEAFALREGRLAAEQQELAKIRKQLETMRDEIAGKMIEIQAEETKNLKTLASTYSNLSPKTAVSILREMDEVTVVKLLSIMKTDEVSALFEEMGKSGDPALIKRAAQFSEKIRLLKSSRTTSS